MNKYNGDYYVIELARNKEYFEIGVDRRGEIRSVVYNRQRIQQYNGRDAEAFALQMTTEFDPLWRRHPDRFPSGRS